MTEEVKALRKKAEEGRALYRSGEVGRNDCLVMVVGDDAGDCGVWGTNSHCLGVHGAGVGR